MAYVMEDPKTKEALRKMVEHGEKLVVFEMGDKPVNKLLDKVQIEGPQDPDEDTWYALVQVDEEYHITQVVA